MFGPVGPYIKRRLLTDRGYELYRPTELERKLIRSPFDDWFSKDIDLFAIVHRANRQALAEVPQWVRAEDLPGSLWRFGVPERWDTGKLELGMTELNEIEADPTSSDLIAFICHGLRNLRYLEIGVSVGKNFFQIARNFPKAKLVGLDIEKPNPVLAEALGLTFTETSSPIVQTVETLSGVDQEVRLTTYRSGNVTYVRGDQFRAETWNAMPQRFNFIFSDGVHSGRAVRSELDFLLSAGLIDTSGPFVMYWDDLGNIEMQSAFNDCAAKLRAAFGRGWHGVHWIHGTYGQRRLNGLFSSESI